MAVGILARTREPLLTRINYLIYEFFFQIKEYTQGFLLHSFNPITQHAIPSQLLLFSWFTGRSDSFFDTH